MITIASSSSDFIAHVIAHVLDVMENGYHGFAIRMKHKNFARASLFLRWTKLNTNYVFALFAQQ